jgi:hypothetical protein
MTTGWSPTCTARWGSDRRKRWRDSPFPAGGSVRAPRRMTRAELGTGRPARGKRGDVARESANRGVETPSRSRDEATGAPGVSSGGRFERARGPEARRRGSGGAECRAGGREPPGGSHEPREGSLEPREGPAEQRVGDPEDSSPGRPGSGSREGKRSLTGRVGVAGLWLTGKGRKATPVGPPGA